MKFNFSEEVSGALHFGRPVVALESTVIAHGLPYPQNIETAYRLENLIRDVGATPGTIGVFDGEVHIGLQNAATVIPLVKGGKLKALAVTSEKRLAELPDVPTMKEAGFGDIGTNAWQAMYAPAGTPKEILDKLLVATLKALGDEKVQAQLDKLQFTLIPTKSLSEVQEWMTREVEVWTPIVKDAKEMADKQG